MHIPSHIPTFLTYSARLFACCSLPLQSLRRGLNSLLLDKIERPHECDVEASDVLQAVCTLLASDGLE